MKRSGVFLPYPISFGLAPDRAGIDGWTPKGLNDHLNILSVTGELRFDRGFNIPIRIDNGSSPRHVGCPDEERTQVRIETNILDASLAQFVPCKIDSSERLAYPLSHGAG